MKTGPRGGRNYQKKPGSGKESPYLVLERTKGAAGGLLAIAAAAAASVGARVAGIGKTAARRQRVAGESPEAAAASKAAAKASIQGGERKRRLSDGAKKMRSVSPPSKGAKIADTAMEVGDDAWKGDMDTEDTGGTTRASVAAGSLSSNWSPASNLTNAGFF